MLHSLLNRYARAAVCAGLLVGTAPLYAQDDDAADSEVPAEQQPLRNEDGSINMEAARARSRAIAQEGEERFTNGVQGNPEVMDRARDIVEGAMEEHLQRQPYSEEFVERVRGQQGNPALIGDQEDAARRAAVMDLLDIDETQSQLYVFVTFGMPIDMIRAYLREAMWSGAILVVKGLPPGMDMMSFSQQLVAPLVGRKGASAALQIDPTLFDLYEVDVVPSIVLNEDLSRTTCIGDASRQETDMEGRVWDIRACRPAAEDSYYRIGGAITLDYALERFIAEGSEQAQVRLDQMREVLGARSGDNQKPADPETWDDIPTPEAREEIRRLLEAQGDVIETEYGITVQPRGVE